MASSSGDLDFIDITAESELTDFTESESEFQSDGVEKSPVTPVLSLLRQAKISKDL